MTDSIRHHPLWTELLPYVKVEYASKESNGRLERFRLELRNLPQDLAGQALGMQVCCADCGKLISPVRSRKAPENKRSETIGHGLYLAASCPLAVNTGCSRGTAVREEYQAIRAEREGKEP